VNNLHFALKNNNGLLVWWCLYIPSNGRILLNQYSAMRVLDIFFWRGRRGRDRMAVGFTNTYAISAYLYISTMLWVRISIRARCTTLCDKVCQWPVRGRWFSSGTPVSSTNRTDCHDITEILLKVALNTINYTSKQ